MSELEALRDEVRRTREQLRLDIVRLEAKIDSKPGLMAMFTAVIVVVFGMVGVIASTIATLHTLRFI